MSHTCFHCRRGEKDYPADGLYSGLDDNDRPYRGYLCTDHADIIRANGGTANLVTPLSAEAWAEAAASRLIVYRSARDAWLKNPTRVASERMGKSHQMFCHAQDRAGLNE